MNLCRVLFFILPTSEWLNNRVQKMSRQFEFHGFFQSNANRLNDIVVKFNQRS
ncbi:MAG: hypothetical protein ACI9UH_001066 [Gammaproteobacteria bacterium]|jgi:hypothetical protein